MSDAGKRRDGDGPAASPADADPNVPASFASLSGQMVRGSAWMIAMRWGMRVIGLVSTVILARLLTPGDYGVVAMAVVVVGFLQVFTFTTFDLALIERADAERAHYDTAWTLQICQGVALAVFIVLLAPVGAIYFNEPRVEAVIYVLALGALAEGFVNIGLVAVRKELDFAKEFRFHVCVRLINFVFTVGLALWLRSYWALVAGQVAEAFFRLIISYMMHRYRPRLSLAKARDIWSFSQWMLLFLIGTYVKNKLDAFVVGRIAGVSEMGSYHVASELSAMPTNEVVMPLGRALFPSYAKLAHDGAEAARAFESVFAIMALCCLPLGFGLAAVAPDLVIVVLGAKWVAAVPLIQWLAVGAIMTGLGHATGIFLSATGRARSNAVVVWANLILLVPAIWVGARFWHIEGIAAARTAVAIAFLLLLLVMLARLGGIRLTSLWRSVWRSIAASCAMVAVVLPVAQLPIGIPVVRLLLSIAVGGMAFVAVVWFLWRICGRPPGGEQAVFDRLVPACRRIRARATGR